MTQMSGVGFEGPDADLWERHSRALQAPTVIALGWDGQDALLQRVLAARTWEGLSAEDKALFEQAEYEISAGLSPTLQHPDNWRGSDWAAEEAAMGLAPATPPVVDESEGKSLPGPDEGDWIGL